ncbi:hypothetical protein EX30DRAFT_333163 [Ascodesmis nigricans]|uniref:Uncharacterized protein n=1 Tax=Ascodesmis nigricans TaxID=341454 RepID=A0A4S2MT18_9PEZI|nr:hypothetical protein EX30DRAFT_333163 [Ascodesmis nigricans]
MSHTSAKEPDYHHREHQTCYLFNPERNDTPSTRPTKKRRTGSTKAKPSTAPKSTERCLFQPLLNGDEPEQAVRLRWMTYHRLWEAQELRTTAILESFNEKTLDDISTFVAAAEPAKYSGKLPTGLVLAGPNIASHGPLFRQFQKRLNEVDGAGPVVILTSKEASNLKGTLKKLIRDATEQSGDLDEDDEEVIVGRKGAKLLNYDLQILANWCAIHQGKKVIVAVQDTEAFDSGILADLVSLFGAYQDRIPFVLLLGIATSLEIFHEKLPKAVIRLMEGEKFDVERAEEYLAQVFNDAVLGKDCLLRLGPTLCNFLVDRQHDHTQSIQTFVAGLKYMYMTHFYANPLSIVLASVGENGLPLRQVLSDIHYKAVRQLPSFKQTIESCIAEERTKIVREMLNNDSALAREMEKASQRCLLYGVEVSRALGVFDIARSCSSSGSRITRSELYSRVLAGELTTQSPLVRELLMLVKRSNSESATKLLKTLLQSNYLLDSTYEDVLEELLDEIQDLSTEAGGKKKKNLTSEFDVVDNALRTTAVSRRIQISEHKSGLSTKDSEYSKIIQKVHDVFEQMFSRAFRPTKDLFLNEIFFYDYLSPHQEVFSPKQRSAVEDGLARPSEYLNCECCYLDDDEKENVLKSTNPVTSIAYQLYLESGVLINAFDLYQAFHTILEGGEEESDEEEGGGGQIDEKTAQALYYRTVAELRYMGFVKPTRKRVDHLQKFAWKGL